jgi:hypothetical protein
MTSFGLHLPLSTKIILIQKVKKKAWYVFFSKATIDEKGAEYPYIGYVRCVLK